jgi:hypothetical protein
MTRTRLYSPSCVKSLYARLPRRWRHRSAGRKARLFSGSSGRPCAARPRCAPVRQVVRNPRGAEGVAAYRGFNSRIGSTAAHPAPDIPAQQRRAGENTGIKALLQEDSFGIPSGHRPDSSGRQPVHARNPARHPAAHEAWKHSAVMQDAL